MGAYWLRVRGSSLGNAVAALCVFAAAWSAGPGLGTPAGVLLGLAQALCDAGAWSIVYFAVLGTLAGLLREGARWLDACGSVAGCSALVFLQGGVLAAAEYLPPIALAGLAFSVMPEGWLDTVKGFLQPRAVLVSDGAGVASLYLLRERARALEEIARLLPDDGEETSIPRLELLACRLCTVAGHDVGGLHRFGGGKSPGGCRAQRGSLWMPARRGALSACAGAYGFQRAGCARANAAA